MGAQLFELPELKLKYYRFGVGKSPHVLVTAALHGDEVTGTYAAYKLIEYLRHKEGVEGTVTVVPVVNVLGFTSRTRLSPVDYVDMNRVFPDGAGAPTTKRIVNFIWELALSSDYVIDLHCAGLNSYQYILALYKEFPRVKELADKMPWDTVVESNGTRGQLFVEASYRGIPAAIIETGGGDGYYDESWGETMFRVVLGTLAHIGAIRDLGTMTLATEKTYYGKLVQARTPVEGFPRPVVKPGTNVHKDEILGYVGDKPISSPATGRVIRIEKNMFLFENSGAASIAPLEGS